jgi:fumarate reductase subunit C
MKDLNNSPIAATQPIGKLSMCNRLWLHRTDIIRATTALFMLWFSLQLMYGMVCITTDEFYRFFYFLRKPIVIAFNAMTLLSAVLHTIYCFYRMAKLGRSMFNNNAMVGVIILMLLLLTLVLSKQLLASFSV